MSKYNIKGGGVYYDLEFVYGDNWTIDFECVDGEGTVLDISAATLQFRISTVAGVTVQTRTVSDGITVTGGGTTGLCTLNITAALQASVAGGLAIVEGTRYLYEFRATASSIVYNQARGHLNVIPSLIA